MPAFPPTLYTIGYGRWTADSRESKFTAALTAAGVGMLIDIRHSPCSSSLDVKSLYCPRAFNLQAAGLGIITLLAAAGIGYRWVVELGNPQKKDPAMRILREHLADPAGEWPIHRGLRLVADAVAAGHIVALMCACGKYAGCHRKPVAEALIPLLPAGYRLADLTG